ncbi:hypothetical protein P170DRAFT_367196 [Aspergillus steynii IBT 23096]|uniref:C3H1-type domain-containing protein n=1 Tax=Aspergillus steynii IBT 23096 TaxID=1392250 RepID=A0A2I2FVS1_9EURO|nr:uncharacterized protein P170DRAFT_367196 [Aspergillus steynii IBT 23096]PLB44732.1 hypothetical protein P170DRAFT_367196 [Aspergillus steynii IBT 23096]
MPTPHFNPAQSQNFQNHHNAAAFASHQPYSQPPAAHGAPYQRRPSYDAAYAPPTAQSAPMYSPVMPTPQHTAASAPAPMMGPPMRWGFENAGSAAGGHAATHGNQRGPRSFNNYSNNHNSNQASLGSGPSHHPNKRDHTSAFGKPRSTGPRVPAPPPVPSFGNPLPSKPPPPVDTSKKPKKKKRKHNQLGLTPKTDEHESSEEEDDVDEEARLAPAGTGVAAPLQFTYKGRTATLQTPAEFAAWIAERKKRFPTQSRVEEKKKAMEEAKKAREEALRQKDSRKQEAKRPQKDARSPKEQASSSADPVDAAAKAKQKADKLRRKLMKEQKRVEKAEADAERARMRVEQLQKGTTGAVTETISSPRQDQTQLEAQGSTATAPDSAQGFQGKPSEHDEIPDRDTETAEGPITLPAGSTKQSQAELSEPAELSSDASDSSDWTSSSGSESSDSDSDDSDDDDDSAPEQISSRREGPERVPPPAREVKKRICRHFARNGRCLRGDQCKFLHEAPQRAAKAKPVEKKGRKGLLQALLGRQKEDDDRRVMEAIMWLGENGHLEAQPAPGNPVEKTDDRNDVEAATRSQGVSSAPVPGQALEGSTTSA